MDEQVKGAGDGWPSVDRVARRALTLAAVVCRSTIEGEAGAVEAETLRESVLAWLADIGVMTQIDGEELALLRAPLGSLTEDQRVDGTWRSEGLVILGWALGRCELPSHDHQADPFAVARALGFRRPAAATVLADARLRAPDELTSAADGLALVSRRLAEGDIEVGGMPLSQVPESVRRAVMSIVQEREQAARWLIGLAATYRESW